MCSKPVLLLFSDSRQQSPPASPPVTAAKVPPPTAPKSTPAPPPPPTAPKAAAVSPASSHNSSKYQGIKQGSGFNSHHQSGEEVLGKFVIHTTSSVHPVVTSLLVEQKC